MRVVTPAIVAVPSIFHQTTIFTQARHTQSLDSSFSDAHRLTEPIRKLSFSSQFARFVQKENSLADNSVPNLPFIKLPPQYTFSPHDMIEFYKSEATAWLSRLKTEQSAHGQEPIAKDTMDDTMKLIVGKGLKHEAAYLTALREQGKQVVEIATFATDKNISFDQSYEFTLAAMLQGPEIIYQAALKRDGICGYADFLIRVVNADGVKSIIDGCERDYHYEPWDTKLSRSAKPEHVLQLCCYADMLAEIQGVRPSHMAIALGDGTMAHFKTGDFMSFYAEIKRRFFSFHKIFDGDSTPLLSKGDYGHWQGVVGDFLLAVDHLSIVTSITQKQIALFEESGVTTVSQLIDTDLKTLPGLADEVFLRLKTQARLQRASQGCNRPEFELILPGINERYHLSHLPEPSLHGKDIFFDIEGYPLVPGGLEYLLGAVGLDKGNAIFHTWWSDTPEQEKVAFENFIDWVHGNFKEDPGMHVYHYAAYEPAAMLRLAKRHDTRLSEVQSLIDHAVFVDLYRYVTTNMVVGTKGYSLKDVEHLYRGARDGTVKSAASSLVEFEAYLDSTSVEERQRICEGIKNYNEDDCQSLKDLYQFLINLRAQCGVLYESWQGRRVLVRRTDNIFDKGGDKDTPALAERLLTRYRDDILKKTERGNAILLLTDLLSYHAREERVRIAELSLLAGMTEEELVQNDDCLAALELVSHEQDAKGGGLKLTYRFLPEQDHAIKVGQRCVLAQNSMFGLSVIELNHDLSQVTVSVSARMQERYPEEDYTRISLIPDDFVPPGPIHDSLYETAQALDCNSPLIAPVLKDLLFGNLPRLIDTGKKKKRRQKLATLLKNGDVYNPDPAQNAYVKAVKNLDGSVLFVQGPPGSGKSTLTAEVIVDLIKGGQRVGITGPSHKAINNLLKKVIATAKRHGVDTNAAKIGEADEGMEIDVRCFNSARDFLAGLPNTYNIVAGTPWLFANEKMQRGFSHLFVDEAGQVPLANAVAVARSTRNLIFVGDPRQLAQPTRASHPGFSGDSVFDFYLKKFPGVHTVPPDAGLFLEKTFRLHPKIATYVSDNFYDGRLKPDAMTLAHVMGNPLANQNTSLSAESGLHFIAVPHDNTHKRSVEEAQMLLQVLSQLHTFERPRLTDKLSDISDDRFVRPEDIIIVAPYNSQVQLIKRLLGSTYTIGTVDRFQGQEALVALVSLTLGAVKSARALEFVLSPNRFNVAISRAKAYVGIVASPNLFDYRPQTLEQWRLLNLIAQIT